MGLLVDIFRADYDSPLNAFHGLRRVTVTNLPGPFEPSDDAPAARLARGPGGDRIIVPDDDERYGPPRYGPMFGGTYAATSDSRYSQATGGRAALPVHDRYETPDQYEEMSR